MFASGPIVGNQQALAANLAGSGFMGGFSGGPFHGGFGFHHFFFHHHFGFHHHFY